MRDSRSSNSRNKSLPERFSRWLKRKRRERAIRSEERRVARELAAKAHQREERDLKRSAPGEAPLASTPFDAKPAEPFAAAPQTGSFLSANTESIDLGGLMVHWKRYRTIRKAVLEQRRLAAQAEDADATRLEERRNKSSIAVASTAPEVERKSPRVSKSFGVGSTDQSASDVKIPYRKRPIYLIKRIVKRCVRQRIPHWLAAMSPALIMVGAIVMPAVSNSENHAAEAIPQLRRIWTESVRSGSWPSAELAGSRVISSGLSDKRDDLLYFDTLIGIQKPAKALGYLISRESAQRELSLAEYRFDVGEAILAKLIAAPSAVDLALRKFDESLRGPLPVEKQIKARKFLANAYAVRGDFVRAVALLEPIRAQDLIARCDLLWLRWNLDSENTPAAFADEVENAMKELTARIESGNASDRSVIAASARLRSVLRQEESFRKWIDSNTSLNADAKAYWRREIDYLSLVTELRSKPLDPEAAWKKLRPILEMQPDNAELTEIAIKLAVGTEKESSKEAYEWLAARVKDDKAESKFLVKVSLIAHANSRWEVAADCYERLIRSDPTNLTALNNLAGIYYKFPPYRLDRALELIERALETTPGNLGIQETKGQILARLGRFDLAKPLLEECLAAFPEEWNLHNTLAQIYEFEGTRNLAEVHRARLAKLRKPSNAPAEDRIPAPKDAANRRPGP